jgi:hypothetical protein
VAADPQLADPTAPFALAEPVHINAQALRQFMPHSTSPLIGNGIDVARLGVHPGERDLAGSALPRSGASDIGALRHIP